MPIRRPLCLGGGVLRDLGDRGMRGNVKGAGIVGVKGGGKSIDSRVGGKMGSYLYTNGVTQVVERRGGRTHSPQAQALYRISPGDDD
jgi:hypothetical protein